MPCYSPLTAYKCFSGEVVFSEHKTKGDFVQLQLPCGQCIGCRLERSRQWGMRCTHEASLHDENNFLTLTFNDEHLPERGQLDYTYFQKFMKRYRKKYEPKKIRHFTGGEYGEQDWRPHFHSCIFGHDWEDKEYWATSPSGEKLYRSKTLEKLWPHGHALIGAVTFESAAYVARYCLKKVTGYNAENHYQRHDNLGDYQLNPEFARMSLRPGIGKGWYEKYKSDVYPHDYVVINGHECKPPKFYDKQYEREAPDEHEHMKEIRKMEAQKRWEDNTPERLRSKEIVTKAKLGFLHRSK